MKRTIPLPPQRAAAGAAPGPAPFRDMAWIPGGTFRMGSDRHYREEAPARDATVAGFWMDRHPVTNAQFGRFVAATGYVTVAERALDPAEYPGALPDLLVPGSVVFTPPAGPVPLTTHFAWWAYVPGASWRHPAGPGSAASGLSAHPVVHVAWEDVAAYAAWAGKTLPTEAEWERAARGGLEDREYAWGDALSPGGRIMANVWQGEFPRENLLLDGWERTSPVGSFPPNGFGLYDMIGNVWEWTADWWREGGAVAGACCACREEEDGGRQASMDPAQPRVRIPRKVLKGGSYLCAPNYCVRYRPAARIPQQVDTGTGHQGFRCIVRVPG
ncbi:formylglycine-generating enzyme family protein [Longimicrobium sp.]|uniref:formylglycine-generating enzyme family protein n=1 Tax=Longimicrobium sp. TaxID=2029185 RepID=UPI0039C95845